MDKHTVGVWLDMTILESLFTTRMGMAFILVFVLIALLYSLVRRDRSASSNIDLEDLLIGEDGRFSKAAAVMLGSFLLTSWVIVYLTLQGKLTEGYFTAYIGAWVVPTVVKLISSKSNNPNNTGE